MALVILAHYAVLLHDVRSQWWAAGRGKQLVKSIQRELSDQWKSAVQWPMDAVQGD